MKDLSKPNFYGYIYMNHFMGIEKGFRPLALFGYNYSDKITFQVPTINSNYQKNDFILRLHTIKSQKYETNRHNFDGLCRVRIFAIKNDMFTALS
jgi:hypothetical protein